MKKDTLSILIPTHCDNHDRLTIGYSLASLAFQIYPFQQVSIVIRDEGLVPAIESSSVRLTMTLLAEKGIKVFYHRATKRAGVANARKELYECVPPETNWVAFVDDDLLIEPQCFGALYETLMNNADVGFAQGSKIELDAKRTYLNDINKVNENLDSDPFPIYFGDAALILFPRAALDLVDWQLVTLFEQEGLAGEDVAMTLLIADKQPGIGVPRARAWHLSPTVERWHWETSSDLLQIQILKNSISKQTMLEAMPHLSNEIEKLYLKQ